MRAEDHASPRPGRNERTLSVPVSGPQICSCRPGGRQACNLKRTKEAIAVSARHGDQDEGGCHIRRMGPSNKVAEIVQPL
jgi:hypothetical protein